MFSRIFNKRASVVPVSPAGEAYEQAGEAAHLDLTVDESIRALHAGLSSLTHMPVAQAAKERGWAALQRQLEHHPVRPASSKLVNGAGAKGQARGGFTQPVLAGHSRGWRVALVSAGALVAIVAVVLGAYSAGLLGGGGDTSPFASVTTTEANAPATTVATGDTTPTTEGAPVTPTTQQTPGTGSTAVTPTTDTTPGAGSTPPTSSTPTTAGGPTPTTGGTTTTQSAPPTTKPAQTTTTNQNQMVSAQRQKNAEAAAFDLADAVIRYFWDDDGDLTGVRSLVASSAYSRLTIMVKSLTDPSGYNLVGTKALSADTVRITLEFADVGANPRYFITVRVDDVGATITDISAGL